MTIDDKVKVKDWPFNPLNNRFIVLDIFCGMAKLRDEIGSVYFYTVDELEVIA